jgi:nitrate/nitrite transporter NarK
MSAPAAHLPPPVTARPPAWRWVHVGVAALSMVATLPGRTHGLGLFTEPILKTFELGREQYGAMNLWATLLGGLFCLPCGWLIDRLGPRAVLTSVMALLALSVGGLALWPEGWLGVFVLILTRGFGQSALSVASLTLIGRSAGTRNGLAMGVYSCLTSVGFVAAFGVLREVVKAAPDEWRMPWAGIGVGVLAAAVLSLLLVRDRVADVREAAAAEPSRTFGQALRSPAFWAFALGTSFYGLVVAGTSLFNESLLAERGFSKEIFLTVTVVGIPVGLAANLLGGWLATRLPLGKLFAGALVLLLTFRLTTPAGDV